MRYTVTWDPEAIDDLADLWLAATDRAAVAGAADRIDRELSIDPGAKGRPFFGQRIFAANPLAVTFEVSTADRIVKVIQIWRR
jgi:hypothetical protein